MPPVDTAATLADLVLASARRARLFERLQLDFCCGGRRTLADACAQRGLDADTIATVIAAFDEAPPDAGATGDEHDVARASIGELCDHVVAAHHDLLRRELPRTAELLAKVVRVHGPVQPQLHDVQRVFGSLRAALEAHLAEEEDVLFPACRELEAEPGAAVDDAVLARLEEDHASVAAALIALRELTEGYLTERAACGTHRALLEALHALELDLHQHVHEENNILFPRVRALARA